MITIVKPKEHIDKLWGKQRIRDGDIYRMMRYVLRVDHDGKVLLHNVVTGHLVVLEQEEAEVLDMLPVVYTPAMELLVAEHYLVPEEYDEHQKVVNLRNILWRTLDIHAPKDITFYTVLPTTACNARCWYCYEKGITPITMSSKVADDVVSFIKHHCGGKKIRIRWFGGEPTLAAHRIDQISQGLLENGIEYDSIITTNGYLFNEAMIRKAIELWHTKQVNISVDGVGETYNRIKAYAGVDDDNPYERVMGNVDLMLNRKMPVVIRMNYDMSTWKEFPILLRETRERFHENPRLMVHSHQINSDVPGDEWLGMEAWLNQKNDELDDMAIMQGNYINKTKLPALNYVMCAAGSSECVTIRPDGKMVLCPEQLGDEDVVGDVTERVINPMIANAWKCFADHERCRMCVLFPYCARMSRCACKDRCSGKKGVLKRMYEIMILNQEHYDEVMQ